ncbi:T9SS type A sorting domain-containing protein [Nostoc ellipsosporum NOK]|nr:T9SS type A sorting domain-containing protein [Nostoc ellipsosporum NOK]
MRYLLFLAASLFVKVSAAQLSAGSSGITVLPGTTLSYEGLVLIPGNTLTINSNVLTRTTTPETSGTLNSISRVFTFTSPLTFTGNAEIRYQAGELNGNLESLMQVAYNPAASGGTWTINTGSTQGTAGSFRVSNNFTGINVARFTAFNPTATLPVVLERFDGIITAAGNQLTWTTGLELNVLEIQLERSANGIAYTKIAGFAPLGSSSSYVYTDRGTSGVQYYRLKTVDIDGGFSYSPVVRLSPARQEYKLQLSPNPTPGQLIISSPLAKGQVVVRNAQGQTVLQQSWQQGRVIDIRQLPSGTYMVTLSDGSQSFAGKIVKQ